MKKCLFIILLLLGVGPLLAQESKDKVSFFEDKEEFVPYYSNAYSFHLEVGFAQDQQRSKTNTYPNLYLNGPQVGAMFDYNFAYNFTLQAGLRYSLTVGQNDQHYVTANLEHPQVEYIRNTVLSHQLVVPIRLTYTQPLWKRLALYFYTGPEIRIGLAQTNMVDLSNVSEPTLKWLQEETSVKLVDYDRYVDKDLYRTNIQWGIGGGLQWDTYRLYSGYTFGLNNLAANSNIHMWDWGWNVTFSWQFK